MIIYNKNKNSNSFFEKFEKISLFCILGQLSNNVYGEND